jgi:putative ABC transport system substrate-binding protein
VIQLQAGKKDGRMMKNWKKALVVLMALTVGVTAGCGGKKQETGAKKDKAKIGVVQLVQHAALDAANKGFIDALEANGYKVGQNLEVDQQNAQGDQSNLQTIAQRFVNNKVDMIYAIATPAAQTMANATKKIPIVGSAITDYKEAKLIKDNNKPGTNVTGTTDMNPIDRQVALLQTIFPKAKTIGVIYNSSEVNSQLQVSILKKEAEKKGLTVKEATVTSVNDIQQAAQSLVSQKVDVIYIPTDNVMASAVPVLTKVTNEAKIPVIAGEENEVKKGCLATIGIDYYKLGYQTGLMAVKILRGEAKPQDMPIETQKDMKVTVNETTAKTLGVTIPDSVLKGAEIAK